jgi:IS5 family transposase
MLIHEAERAADAASSGFEKDERSRKRELLAEMGQIVPWKRPYTRLSRTIAKVTASHRPGARMLRIYFLQQWFNLSDPRVEEALRDGRAAEAFAGINLRRGGPR